MVQYNSHNEKTKKEYERYLALDERLSPASLKAKWNDIRKYEEHTGFADFKTFNIDRAMAFKAAYIKQTNPQGQPLEYATIGRTLRNLKEFFTWLAQQPAYRKKVKTSDTRAFNLSLKEQNMARHKPYTHPPTLTQLEKVLNAMPHTSPLERRNRAILACIVLTGVRVEALISLQLKHMDMERQLLMQDGREVRTKFSKAIQTQFFPVPAVFMAELSTWVSYLLEEQACGLNTPLFPSSKGRYDKSTGGFKQELALAEPITSTTTIRTMLKEACAIAKVPYFNPHLVRNTLIELGEKRCTTPEQFKAWSQNIGHKSPLTTFNSYGEVSPHRQWEIIKSLS